MFVGNDSNVIIRFQDQSAITVFQNWQTGAAHRAGSSGWFSGCYKAGHKHLCSWPGRHGGTIARYLTELLLEAAWLFLPSRSTGAAAASAISTTIAAAT